MGLDQKDDIEFNTPRKQSINQMDNEPSKSTFLTLAGAPGTR